MRTKRFCLGIHIGHDRGAALVKDGILFYAVAQERLDRKKHSPSPEIPYQAINAILSETGATFADLSGVGISYTNVVIDNIVDELAAEICEHYSVPAMPVFGAGHHYCHALSSLHTSGFEEADILVADGAGDIVGDRIEAESVYTTGGGIVSLAARRLQDFPLTYAWRRNSFHYSYMHALDREKQISIGRKYEQLTYLIGFQHGEAGKTMGLASYGRSLVKGPLQKITGIDFSLTYQDIILELESYRIKLGLPHHVFVRKFRADIARTAQDFVESAVLKLLTYLRPNLSHNNICLAGGLFLNCPLNSRIVKEAGWAKVHIVPPAGDDGQAVGAAFHAYNSLFGKASTSSSALPFLGPSYSREAIESAIAHFRLRYETLSNRALARKIALLLSQEKVVGILRGRSEVGPRALCHRSILADPRQAEMRDYLNEKVKYRESFRPFAPVVIAEEQFKFFDLPQESPYMLLAGEVRPAFRTHLAATTHVDNTARVQAIYCETEPFIHALLLEFKKLTGFPILLNTSFNLADEPIVESPHDALSTYLRSNIDVLVLENALIVDKLSRVPVSNSRK